MKILSFGEILWDIFGEEKKIGGAPFNFAAHAAKLGAESYMISAVGNDGNGVEALEAAKNIGIKCDYISVLREYKTGVCNVTLNNGKPRYDLIPDTAYDHIPYVSAGRNFDAVYMGTLAMRSPVSRRSFERIITHTEKKEVFFDINLRGSFYTRELIGYLLRESTILKVSDEEIGFFGRQDTIRTCVEISKNYPKLKYICVTLGKEGAIVYDCRRRTVFCSDKPKGKAVSTVGAGDSFGAAFLVNYLAGKEISECLDRAVRLSDFVVTRLEAVPDYDPEDIFK